LVEEKHMRQETNTRVQLMDPILWKLYGSLPSLPYILNEFFLSEIYLTNLGLLTTQC
jgi:hypothetical protein